MPSNVLTVKSVEEKQIAGHDFEVVDMEWQETPKRHSIRDVLKSVFAGKPANKPTQSTSDCAQAAEGSAWEQYQALKEFDYEAAEQDSDYQQIDGVLVSASPTKLIYSRLGLSGEIEEENTLQQTDASEASMLKRKSVSKKQKRPKHRSATAYILDSDSEAELMSDDEAETMGDSKA